MAVGLWLNGEPVPIVVPPVAWLYHVTVLPDVQVAERLTGLPLQTVVGDTDTLVGLDTQVLLGASPVIVQPLPPLAVVATKLALAAVEAQYWRPTAPILLPVTVPALKPMSVAS